MDFAVQEVTANNTMALAVRFEKSNFPLCSWTKPLLLFKNWRDEA